MKWVRTKVDLEKHVIVPELNPNMDSPDKFVEDYVYNLSKTTIDKSQPLWDLHLLNVKTSDSQAVGIFRIHHSLGDGASLMSLLLACTRQINFPDALPTIPTKKKKREKTDNYKALWICRFLMVVWSVFQLFWNTVVDIFMFIVTALFLKDTDNPLKGPPGVEFTPRRIVHRTVSLDDIKFVKNAMNAVRSDTLFVFFKMPSAFSIFIIYEIKMSHLTYGSVLCMQTINDVALGITQAGLSRYLNRIYGELFTYFPFNNYG